MAANSPELASQAQVLNILEGDLYHFDVIQMEKIKKLWFRSSLDEITYIKGHIDSAKVKLIIVQWDKEDVERTTAFRLAHEQMENLVKQRSQSANDPKSKKKSLPFKRAATD